MHRTARIVLTASIALMAAGTALIASADHSWGTYHWYRTANPFTLTLGDNVSSVWDAYLQTSSADWSASEVLDTVVATGMTSPKNCKAIPGRVEICNSRYGNNGWLGIASIWTSGGHIAQGTVKMNDTYFNTAKYNTPAWRNLVMCQEIGHTFGLDHQDENFANTPLGTCMDYSNDPVPNQHPNTHDYEELATIYAHQDGTAGTTTAAASAANDEPGSWGTMIREGGDGKPAIFELDLGNGQKKFTFVIWTEESHRSHHHE